jgi:hypothetical protein
LVAGTDTLNADVTQIGGVAQSATDLKDFADAGYDPATNKVQGVVLVDTVTTLTGHTAQTGDSFARIGATGSGLTTLSTAAELAKVPKSDGTATWNATALAAIQSEANDALVAYDPPTKAELDTAAGAVTLANGAHGGAAASITLSDYANFQGSAGVAADLLVSTTIATLTSQVSFTLTTGSADDDAYNGQTAIITDSATSTQKAVATISDYVGATKAVTLSADPAVFGMAAGDSIAIVATAVSDTLSSTLSSILTAAQHAEKNAAQAAQSHLVGLRDVSTVTVSHSETIPAGSSFTFDVSTFLYGDQTTDTTLGVLTSTGWTTDAGFPGSSYAMITITPDFTGGAIPAGTLTLEYVDQMGSTNTLLIRYDGGERYFIPLANGTVSRWPDYITPTSMADHAAAIAAVPTAAEIKTAIEAAGSHLALILADTAELQTDDVPGLIAALNDPTAAAIATAVIEESIADGVSLTAGTLGDRIRKIKWALCNKMEINETTGEVVLYKDNGTTVADSGTPAVDSAAGTTTRDPLFGTT